MEQDFLSLIRTFLSTTEYADIEIPIFKLVFTENIYNYVLQDDPEYAKRIMGDTIYGMYYVTKNYEQQLIIEKTDNIVEIMHNLFHEMIHILDFNVLAKHKNNYNIRELQDDTFFILWSEFHAEYYSYKYLINCAKESIFPQNVQIEIQRKFASYFNQHIRLEIQYAADFCVRLYGQYIALHDVFEDDVDMYPSQFYINSGFLDIYNYLNKHKTFEKIKDNFEELERIFRRLESNKK